MSLSLVCFSHTYQVSLSRLLYRGFVFPRTILRSLALGVYLSLALSPFSPHSSLPSSLLLFPLTVYLQPMLCKHLSIDVSLAFAFCWYCLLSSLLLPDLFSSLLTRRSSLYLYVYPSHALIHPCSAVRCVIRCQCSPTMPNVVPQAPPPLSSSSPPPLGHSGSM